MPPFDPEPVFDPTEDLQSSFVGLVSERPDWIRPSLSARITVTIAHANPRDDLKLSRASQYTGIRLH